MENIPKAAQNVFDEICVKMQAFRDFKQPMPLTEVIKDDDGFTLCIITDVQDETTGERVFWLVPSSFKPSLEMYKEALVESYAGGDQPIIPIEELPKFRSHMVIAKIDNKWARARIISLVLSDKLVGLEDIDTGKQSISVLPRDPVKVPLVEELKKAAYGFKATFDGPNVDSYRVGDAINIKIVVPVPYGAHMCEIKPKPKKIEVEAPKGMPKKQQPETYKNRNLIDDLDVKDLPTGQGIQLLYCDGTKLDLGLLHVCESTPANWEFYGELGPIIQAYIDEHQCNGYKPV